jgi:hypothetical protein
METVWGNSKIVLSIDLIDFMARAWYKQTWFKFALPQRIFDVLPTDKYIAIAEMPDIGYVVIECTDEPKIIYSENPCVIDTTSLENFVKRLEANKGKIGLLASTNETTPKKSA